MSTTSQVLDRKTLRHVRIISTEVICRVQENNQFFNLINNQRDAALSSHVYSSLQGYSTCFGCFLHPSSGVQLKLQMHSLVQFMCRCGLNPMFKRPRPGVYFTKSSPNSKTAPDLGHLSTDLNHTDT
jgi:hypothetical protein